MASFSDNDKMIKFKFYQNNIEYNITSDGKQKIIHRLRNTRSDLCDIGRAQFNWNNDICKHCNKEYGCISITYCNSNTNYNQQSVYTFGNKPKTPIKKSPHNSIYCIGCFMAKHNSICSPQNKPRLEHLQKPETFSINKISYWKN